MAIPANQGVTITAKTETGETCGKYTLTPGDAIEGTYGFLHCVCGGKKPDCANQDISFEVNDATGEVEASPDTIWDEGKKQANLSYNIVLTTYHGTITVNGEPIENPAYVQAYLWTGNLKRSCGTAYTDGTGGFEIDCICGGEISVPCGPGLGVKFGIIPDGFYSWEDYW